MSLSVVCGVRSCLSVVHRDCKEEFQPVFFPHLNSRGRLVLRTNIVLMFSECYNIMSLQKLSCGDFVCISLLLLVFEKLSQY